MFALLAVACAATWSVSYAADDEASKSTKFEATCPVSGAPAKEKSVVAIGKGLNAYFCCDNCPKAYKEKPEKFDLKVRRQLLETGQMVQVGCPVCGKPVDGEHTVAVGKTKLGFCCEKCQTAYQEADEEKQLKMAFADLPKAFTRQTVCPVSGKPINPEAVVEHEGHKVFFCCPGCPGAFKADPAKFTGKLPQFGDEQQGLPASSKDKG